jgi:hypothetical protein
MISTIRARDGSDLLHLGPVPNCPLSGVILWGPTLSDLRSVALVLCYNTRFMKWGMGSNGLNQHGRVKGTIS